MPSAWCRMLCRVPGAVPGAGCVVLECCVLGRSVKRWVGAECASSVPGVVSRVLGMKVALSTGMGARRYDQLTAWQLANDLKQKVYALVDNSTARNDRKFSDQITDAAGSAPRNPAEGFACYGHPQFARYVRIAKASLVETQNHLGDGVDRRHWSPIESTPLKALADRAIGACVRLLTYLESTDAPQHRLRSKGRRNKRRRPGL